MLYPTQFIMINANILHTHEVNMEANKYVIDHWDLNKVIKILRSSEKRVDVKQALFIHNDPARGQWTTYTTVEALECLL